MTRSRSTALGLLLAVLATTTHACGHEQGACTIEDGTYHIALPEAENPPLVVFIHGWGSSGESVLRNQTLMNGFLDAGYALVAPDGTPRQNANGRSWAFHPNRQGSRDEVAFIQSVRDDAVARFGLDADATLLTGFSIGGSMTAYTACSAPDSFSAFAPLGGNFWRPHPEACAGPVKLLHTHGWTDGTVPLEGRAVNRLPITDPDAFVQGDIFYAMQIWRQTNGCVHSKADRFVTDGTYLRRAWDRCDGDTALELAIFPGGHVIPKDWPQLVTSWFEGL